MNANEVHVSPHAKFDLPLHLSCSPLPKPPQKQQNPLKKQQNPPKKQQKNEKKAAKVLLDCEVELPENVANAVRDLITIIEAGEPSLAPPAAHTHTHTHATAAAPTAGIGTGIGQRAFCLSNPSAPDCPIVYASPGFSRLTGYETHRVVGRNCRFLQVRLWPAWTPLHPLTPRPPNRPSPIPPPLPAGAWLGPPGRPSIP